MQMLVLEVGLLLLLMMICICATCLLLCACNIQLLPLCAGAPWLLPSTIMAYLVLLIDGSPP